MLDDEFDDAGTFWI